MQSGEQGTEIVEAVAPLRNLEAAVESIVRGKSETVRLAVVCLLAEGHLLIEDAPGVGKTTLARSLARGIDCAFRRIQFTSDLLPSDILGVSVFNQQSGSFDFRRGPIFANVVLADELNRTTPKTQSALLEAMSEGRVSVDNHTHTLPRPFMVVATQNPVEHHGTYPLPESQLDRFLMRIRMGYPDKPQSIVSFRCSEPLTCWMHRYASRRYGSKSPCATIFSRSPRRPDSRS
jgi:MoxR-like ATPase